MGCWVEVEEVIIRVNPLYIESFILSRRLNSNTVASYFNSIHEYNIMPVTTSSLNTFSEFNGVVYHFVGMFLSSKIFRLL